MAQKNLFDFVKQIVTKGPATGPIGRAPSGGGAVPPPSLGRPPEQDAQNPASIARIGRSNDGRELIMTQGFGTFLVDREAPTICYYHHGTVAEIPTIELESLVEALMSKRIVAPYERQYVDLLNVAVHELELRQQGQVTAIAPPAPKAPGASSYRADDKQNPATIMRVGRSHQGAELVMTLGLGTFVLHREVPTLRYFDRGREWDIPDLELTLLVESLMAKQDVEAHRYTYIDLLNVASYVAEQRRGGQA